MTRSALPERIKYPPNETFPRHLVEDVPVHQKRGMDDCPLSVQQLLRHAKSHGVYQVFDTAYDSRLLSATELAELAMGLIKIQRASRPHWQEGQPMVRNRRTGKIDQAAPFKSPKGILGSYRDPLIAALLEGLTAKQIVKLLPVTASEVQQVQEQLDAQSNPEYEGEVLMPYYRVTVPGEGGGTSTSVFAESESDAKSQVRDDLGVKRLPNGSAVAEIKAPKGAWRDLPPAEKAAYLLEHPTVPDHAWTEEKRSEGESRSDFIARLLGSE